MGLVVFSTTEWRLQAIGLNIAIKENYSVCRVGRRGILWTLYPNTLWQRRTATVTYAVLREAGCIARLDLFKQSFIFKDN